MPDADNRESEVLPNLTQRIVEGFYRLDFEPLLSRIAASCVWTTPAHDVYRGADAIRSLVSGIVDMPAFHLYDPSFELIGDAGDGTALVAGGYRLLTDPESRCLLAASQRITVAWRFVPAADWRLTYLHMSNEWHESSGTERPFQVGRQTWRYAQEMIRRGIADTERSVTVRDVDGGLRVFDVSDILFARASGKRCVVHTGGGEHEVACSLAALEAKLPDGFIRVHRSYMVSCRHVAAFGGVGITLTDGTRIPVPARRRVQLKRLFERRETGESQPEGSIS